MTVERYDAAKTYTVIYYDANQKYYYLKRFIAELNEKPQVFIDETEGSYMVSISDDDYPQVKIIFGGQNEGRPDELIDAEEFIGVKSHGAKGKRLTTYETVKIEFIEPLQKDTVVEDEQAEETDEDVNPEIEVEDDDDNSQMELF